ncbi:MAG: ATP-binding protein, partial [Bacteroidota bacterium]|nr:ATP-binding protein [Bacteroidota bacterium]
QHLDPQHESMLPEILERETKIPVHEIRDNIPLAPNHIYIIPENKILTAIDGVLKLTQRDIKIKNLPIDIFFASLAEVHGNFAVGVVLTGTASDGTEGLKAIKANGGITIAQDPKSATYAAMPQSAINAGVVDFILTPEKIASQLAEIIKTYNNNSPQADEEVLSKDDEAVLRQILLQVREHRGVDFTYYKQTTLRRRIARRIAINKISTLDEYLVFLRNNKAELEFLFHDLLITVTSFFRDTKVYHELCNNILPALLNNKSAEDLIRIWIAGCSTGEEAFSMAICLHEALALSKQVRDIKIQIFASDISENVIKKARSATFSPAAMRTVSDERIKNYFTKVNGNYVVDKSIRDMCIFAPHNFLKDPPFAKMDLVSSRNALIYMDASLQKKALTNFYYALNEKGFLVLGKSETTSAAADLFVPFLKNEKIYTRGNVPGRFMRTQTERKEEELKTGKLNAEQVNKIKVETSHTDFRKSAEALLLSNYTPAAVIVNDQMDIVHIHGKITPFLEPSPGKPTFNLLKMAKGSLAFELRNALLKVKTTGNAFSKEAIAVKDSEKQQHVSFEIIPMESGAELHYLILFRLAETTIPERAASGNKTGLQEAQIHNEVLEKELMQLREDMRSITEDQEAANEELQSANEELESGNEEMQSLNEELETSKEELQATNEELMIVNQELSDKQKQLNSARLFAESIVETIREPLLIINKAFCIVSANVSFYKIFKTNEQETEGKFLFEIGNRQWENQQLRILLQKIIPENTRIEDFEITNDFPELGKRTMLLNARLVINQSDHDELILLAIEDVTMRKQADQKLQSFADDLEKDVKEKTADLTQLNLQLDQFAYVASHDLQEPLRKIITFVSRVQENHKSGLSVEVKTYLNKIGGAAGRMRKLIEELLEYSRLVNYDKILSFTDLNAVLENVINDFELMIEEKQAKITSNTLPVISAISLQMNQLFYNLISNALKFTRENELPVLTVTSNKLSEKQVDKLFPQHAATTYYEIVFRDNGMGFDQKYAEQIFVVFQRLHQNSNYTGIGIGLSIIKKIVENHHGKIFVEAKENEGAAFHIILPAQQEY